MNVKGGAVYIDFKGIYIRATGNTTLKGIYAQCDNAVKSNKPIFITNVGRTLSAYANVPITIPVLYILKGVTSQNIFFAASYMNSTDSASSVKTVLITVKPDDSITFS